MLDLRAGVADLLPRAVEVLDEEAQRLAVAARGRHRQRRGLASREIGPPPLRRRERRRQLHAGDAAHQLAAIGRLHAEAVAPPRLLVGHPGSPLAMPARAL